MSATGCLIYIGHNSKLFSQLVEHIATDDGYCEAFAVLEEYLERRSWTPFPDDSDDPELVRALRDPRNMAWSPVLLDHDGSPDEVERAVTAIRALRPCVPVIVVTRRPSLRHAGHARQAGAEAWFPLPLTSLPALVESIEAAQRKAHHWRDVTCRTLSIHAIEEPSRAM